MFKVKEKEKWQPNPAVLDDMSNYRRDYVVREMNKTLSCKPENKPYESDAKWEHFILSKSD